MTFIHLMNATAATPLRQRIVTWVLTPRSPVEVVIALMAPFVLHVLVNAVLSLAASLLARLVACVLPRTLGAAAAIRPEVRRTCVCVRLDAFGACFHHAKLLHIAVHGTLRLQLRSPSVRAQPMPTAARMNTAPPLAPSSRMKRMVMRTLLRLASHARVVLRNIALEIEFMESGGGVGRELVRFAPATMELTGEKKVTTSGLAQNVDGVLCATLTVVGYAPFACTPEECCGEEDAGASKPTPRCANGLATGDGGHLELYTELAWSRGGGPGSLLQLRRLALSCEAPGAVVRLPARCIARIVALAAAAAPPSAAAPGAAAPAPVDTIASLLSAHCAGARVTLDVASIAVESSALLRGVTALPVLVRARATGMKLDVRASRGTSSAPHRPRSRCGATGLASPPVSGASAPPTERAAAQGAAAAPTLAIDASLASLTIAALVDAQWTSVLALPEVRVTSSVVFTRDFVTSRAALGPAWCADSSVDAVSFLFCTVTFHANHAHNLTRSP